MCMFDIAVHNPATHQDALEMDIEALWYGYLAELEGVSTPKADWRDAYSKFFHLMQDDGYDVGYYGYLW